MTVVFSPDLDDISRRVIRRHLARQEKASCSNLERNGKGRMGETKASSL